MGYNKDVNKYFQPVLSKWVFYLILMSIALMQRLQKACDIFLVQVALSIVWGPCIRNGITYLKANMMNYNMLWIWLIFDASIFNIQVYLTYKYLNNQWSRENRNEKKKISSPKNELRLSNI